MRLKLLWWIKLNGLRNGRWLQKTGEQNETSGNGYYCFAIQ
ncbi:hypothetical protein LEP1GSC062_3279 [Leptospira alexanderi serovar Manhao 3 str. L 60]|uniref:Uncharacterized protein n=1 Tax=Leptospira alexanderi serovar Manhao 3 str. L 60 TaxID=1049759 RepID=V6HV85_9LEPT|nr:hypothetical protein LEP1GSC062_3279 [Leptospira alexanderi serovar Manhao 3 str. L 60]